MISTRVVFKRKPDPNGEVERYKCSFVAWGFRRALDLDNIVKFAPRFAAGSIRVPMAEVAMADIKICQIDAKQAFKEEKAEEEVLIQLPGDFQDFPNSVGKLNRPLHGIVQASRS